MIAQSEFKAALLDAARPAPEGLTDGAGVPTTKRFDVYRNNVAVSLTEALMAAFPVIRKLVGDDFFKAMAGVYLRTHLPKSPILATYGDEMPRFLKRFGPAQSLAYLPDVARLEIALRESYHAADADPIGTEALGALAPDRLMATRVALAPSLRLLSASYPAHSIYRANTEPNAPAPVMRPETILVTRPGFDPVQTRISRAAFDFFTALHAGDTLGVAMTKAGPQLDLGKALGLLLQQRAIIRLT